MWDGLGGNRGNVGCRIVIWVWGAAWNSTCDFVRTDSKTNEKLIRYDDQYMSFLIKLWDFGASEGSLFTLICLVHVCVIDTGDPL